MKLLGWMHRKLMQNSIEPMKSPSIGAASSFSLQTLPHEQNYFVEPAKLHNSSSCYNKFEESLDPFEFLSIGTFGVDLLSSTEPPTPTLPMDITENDLNLINYELEKFLDAEETEFNNDTSERSSHASIITLSYRAMDGTDCEGMAACPLQNYLFAASVELVETEKEVKRERASLGELFKRSSIVEDEAAVKRCGEAEKQCKKGNVAHFMKKMVKKFHSSSNTHTAPSNPTKKKLSKSIVKMFQKKVYPEEMAEKQFMKVSKDKNRNISHEDNHSQTKKTKKKTIKLSLAGICKGASPVNAGHWIKTDSDYFVLEL